MNLALFVRFLAIPLLASAAPLHAAIITTAHAEAELPFGLGSCNMTSSDVVHCSLMSGFDSADSDASASAGLQGVSAAAGAGTFGLGGAKANASATFDGLVVVVGSGPPGVLIGHYIYSRFLFGNPGGDLFGEIVQGDATKDAFNTLPGGPFTLMSHFAYGIPFELTMSLSVAASGPVPERVEATFQGIRFTDQNGNPLNVVEVTAPEPGSFPIFVFLTGMYALRRQDRACQKNRALTNSPDLSL